MFDILTNQELSIIGAIPTQLPMKSSKIENFLWRMQNEALSTAFENIPIIGRLSPPNKNKHFITKLARKFPKNMEFRIQNDQFD